VRCYSFCALYNVVDVYVGLVVYFKLLLSVSSSVIYRVAEKSKRLPNDQKLVLKPVTEIRFSRQIKVWNNENNIICWH